MELFFISIYSELAPPFTFYFLLFTFYFLLFTFYFLLFTFYFPPNERNQFIVHRKNKTGKQ